MTVLSFKIFNSSEEFERWQINNPKLVESIIQMIPVLNKSKFPKRILQNNYAFCVTYKKEVEVT